MNCSFEFLHYAVRDAKSKIGPHRHSNHELVYYVSGSGKGHIGKTKYTYGPNQFLIVEPGCPHDEYRNTSTDVIFTCFRYENGSFRLKNGLYNDTHDLKLYKLLTDMIYELNSMHPYYDMKLNALLTESIVEAGRVTGAAAVPESDSKVAYAMLYIQQYHGEKIDHAQLAATMGYSYDYFRRLFKASTGYSLMQYVVRSRIERAKEMLAHSRDPITQIALECGFFNSSQFCTMFKKETGLSPGRYRQSREGAVSLHVPTKEN